MTIAARLPQPDPFTRDWLNWEIDRHRHQATSLHDRSQAAADNGLPRLAAAYAERSATCRSVSDWLTHVRALIQEPTP